MSIKKVLIKLFPDSILANESKPTTKVITEKDRARFGQGDLAGRTGDPFVDDPFFNPWAPGGSFNK